MKKLSSILFAVIIFLFVSTPTFAVQDPLSVPNNKFGVHIFNENDLENAFKLVNSTNGDWGYVTFVIAENERDHDRWQKAFDQMRRLHLIPIVRVATKPKGDVWEKPNDEEINNWISFLNSLNWVTENRYVTIGNEPNHAKEWGGTVNASEYGKYLETFAKKLKEASNDFFVLPAGLDASATNVLGTMEEARFLKQMIASNPMVFENIDGWTSHSYPNPAFSGSETDRGKGTIRSFEWEAAILKSLGVDKNLPIFITETGWSNKDLSESKIGKKLDYAYTNVWTDKNIVAVTPFILNYPQEPFGVFSWTKQDGSFYSFYETIKNLSKTKGEPKQVEKGTILGAFAQPLIPNGSDYLGLILAKNTGQSIWNQNKITIGADFVDLPINNLSFSEVEPGKLGLILFKAAAPESTGIYTRSLFLRGGDKERITSSFPIEAYIVKLDKMQLNSFFDTIRSYFRSILGR